MDLMWIFWLLLIGLIAGWLAGQIMRGHDFGLVVNLIVGVTGAILGGLLFRLAGFSHYGLPADLVVATVGAMLLLLILTRIKR